MGMNDADWIRMELHGDILTLTPETKKENKKKDKQAHLKKLESIDDSWFDYDEWKQIRKEFNARFDDEK